MSHFAKISGPMLNTEHLDQGGTLRMCVCVKERHCAKEINRSHIWQAQNAAGRTSSLNTDHVLLIQR